MYATDIMVEEHANISRMLRVIKNMCCSILDGAAVDTKDFTDIIDFVRNYADVHHHQKEEHTLFPEMVEHMGPLADTIVTHGMLVEHDLLRSHIRNLDEALKLYDETSRTEYKLDILTEAMAYANRLQVHIEKENNVVYPFSDRELSDEIKEKINAEVRRLFDENEKNGINEKYLTMLTRLEAKYNPLGYVSAPAE